MAGGGDKTEKATPKKREDARNKGQVARSADINGAFVLIAGLFTLAATGGDIVAHCREAMHDTLLLTASAPDVVRADSIGTIMLDVLKDVGLSVAPIAFACAIAGIVASVAQVRFKITPQAIKPEPKKLNPAQGFKQIFGPNAAVEGAKSVTKVVVVGAIVVAGLLPALPELGTLVGMSAEELGAQLAGTVLGIAKRAAFAYLLIGVADYFWQRHKHEKSLKMDKQEIKEESKGQSLPAEVRSAQRRRAMQMSRARMMDAVPEADVIVTNPTHFSVALKYGDGMLAPEVVAKGQDLTALRIREIAREHGIPILPNPPLARGLYASVEVGQAIPEEFFHAVAQVLAFVYRTANKRAAVA
jgi:flagellar biosynthesis protein FlhB